MSRGALQVESADGSRIDIPEFVDSGNVDAEGERIMVVNATYESKWASVQAGNETIRVVSTDPKRDKPRYTVVLDADAITKLNAEQAASQAIRDEIDSRTVMVTIDDGVMLKTEARFKLQTVPDVPELATVKARMVAQHGVANPSHVLVETLAEFKARQP